MNKTEIEEAEYEITGKKNGARCRAIYWESTIVRYRLVLHDIHRAAVRHIFRVVNRIAFHPGLD